MRIKAETDIRFKAMIGSLVSVTIVLATSLFRESESVLGVIAAMGLFFLAGKYILYYRSHNYSLTLKKTELTYRSLLIKKTIKYRDVKTFAMIKTIPSYDDGYHYTLEIKSGIRAIYIGLTPLTSEKRNELIKALKRYVPVRLKRKERVLIL